VEDGRVRLTRAGHESRLDKSARPVKVGDQLVFAVGGRLIAVTVEALGVRRAPAAAARALYSARAES
jgi:ribosomal 50S subunit-recycling heat shock protein